HVIRNQTYGESPRSADVSMEVICNSSAGRPDCAGTTRRSEMLGTWPGIVIVTGAVRPAGNTISSLRSPGEAFSATSTVSSDQVSAPWKFSPRLILNTLTPAEGEISAAWILSRLATAIFMRFV